MSNFSLLWGKILLSSIWIKETKATKLVWVAILALKDADGKVQSSVLGLADAAKVSVEECREALRIFTSPDLDDTSHVEEGRRLRVIPGGWEVVNNDLYKYSSDEKREFWKQQKAEQRAAKARRAAEAERKAKKGVPLPGEIEHQKALNSGVSEGELEKIVERHLPVVGSGGAVDGPGEVLESKVALGECEGKQTAPEGNGGALKGKIVRAFEVPLGGGLV